MADKPYFPDNYWPKTYLYWPDTYLYWPMITGTESVVGGSWLDLTLRLHGQRPCRLRMILFLMLLLEAQK